MSETKVQTRLEQLVAELDSYLPAALKNQALSPAGGTGPGTLRGFHATVAEVFALGRSAGYDEASEERE